MKIIVNIPFIFILAGLTSLGAILPVTARENLATDIINKTILVDWNFNGSKLDIIGLAPEDIATDMHDLVAVVRGPLASVKVYRKEKNLGVWRNADFVTFAYVPQFYALAASMSEQDFVSQITEKFYQIGFARIRIRPDIRLFHPQSPQEIDQFRRAYIARQIAQNNYQAHFNAILHIESGLFRLSFALPATAPEGTYELQVYLFENGKIETMRKSQFIVTKSGIGRMIDKNGA